MHIASNAITNKRLFGALLSIGLAAVLVASWMATAVSASSVVGVTSNIANVPSGENLVLTVTAQNDGDVAELEVDHSLHATYPEFSVYANEANPYGTADDKADFDALGVTVSYNAANSQWVIDLGPIITQGVVSTSGSITFYFVIKDADKNVLWGSMSPTTASNTFSFDLVNGTGDELLPSVDDTPEEDVVVPGVPNTALGL